MNANYFYFSIVVITLNESHNISRLLDCLCKQSYKAFEVIVVDSNSDDDTVAIAECYRHRLSLRTVVMQTRGTSLGRNTGAEYARHERLLFLDADVCIKPDFLEKSVHALRRRKLLVGAGRIRSTQAGWRYRFGVRLFDYGMLLTQYHFPTCTGACIFSSKTVHEFIGGFDTRISLCEDCDYVKRAARTFKFRMLPVFFEFDIRRLKKDGIGKLGWTYLKANTLRLFCGELRNNEIDYPFDHYDPPSTTASQSITETGEADSFSSGR